MNRSRGNPFCELGGADDCTSIIEHVDQIVDFYFPCRGVLGIDSNDPVVVPIDKYTMVLDVVDDAVLAVTHGMKAESGVR